MSILKSIIKDEYNRLHELKEIYIEELKKLPKGSIFKRKIKNQDYYYLNYRDNNKVKSEYLGKENSTKLKQLLDFLKQRKDIEMDLKKVNDGIKEIERTKFINE